MTPEQFWYDDCSLVASYLEAYQNRLNMTAWLNGCYIHIAFSTALGNAFAKKGAPPKLYPDRPLDLHKKKEKKAGSDPQQRELEFRKRLMKYY